MELPELIQIVIDGMTRDTSRLGLT